MSYVQTRCGEYLNFLLSVEFGPEGKHVNSTESLGMEKGKMHVFLLIFGKCAFWSYAKSSFHLRTAHTLTWTLKWFGMSVMTFVYRICWHIDVIRSFLAIWLYIQQVCHSNKSRGACACVRLCVCIFKGKSIRFQVFDLFLQLRKKYCLIWSFFLWKQIICLFFYRINRVLVIQNGCFSS